MIKKIVTILGVRSHLVKASVISRAFDAIGGDLSDWGGHVGQHFAANMSDVFLSGLQMRVSEYDLNIHVVHVEAGLRSFNIQVPEEANCILAIAFRRGRSHRSVPRQITCATRGLPRIESSGRRRHVGFCAGLRCKCCCRWRTTGGSWARRRTVCSGYLPRAENTDVPDRLHTIMGAIEHVVASVKVVLPTHPRARAVLSRENMWDELVARVIVTRPLDYVNMMQIDNHAAVIATDSKGVQKEAFFHGVPRVTLRDETEWTELVVGGRNCLAPPVAVGHAAAVVLGSVGLQGDPVEPYGAGNAARLIVDTLSSSLR